MQFLEERVIEIDKVKMALFVFFSIGFVLLGVFLLVLDARSLVDLVLSYVIGITCIGIFSISALYSVKKLVDQSPGMILSQEGILDNSSGIPAGKIPWSDVIAIRQYQNDFLESFLLTRTSPLIRPLINSSKYLNQKYVSIYVKDPEKYINNGNILMKLLYRANMRMVGTPITISAIGLKIDHEGLFQAIQEYFRNGQGPSI